MGEPLKKTKIIISGAARLDEKYTSSFSHDFYDVQLISEPRPTESQIISLIKDAGVYILAGEEVLTEEILRQASKLRLIACMATCAEHFVDIDVADRLGIAVASTPDLKVMYDAMGEFLLGLIIALRRKIIYFHNEQKAGRVHEMDTPLLKDSVVGIIGMGRVGSKIAELLYSSMKCNIVYTARSRKTGIEELTNATMLSLESLLEVSDVVIMACPYDKATCGLLGKKEISSMKPGAVLINTSEAALVDGEALYEALLNGDLAGAAFDDKNWDRSPVIKEGRVINMPAKLMELPDDKFICTPYVGATTSGVWNEMSDVAFSTVRNYLALGTDKNLTNRNLDVEKNLSRGL